MCENHENWWQYHGFAWFFKVGGVRILCFLHPCWLSFSTPFFYLLFIRFLVDFRVHLASKVNAFAYIFVFSFFHIFLKLFYPKTVFSGYQKTRTAAWASTLWRAGKTPHSRKNMDSVWEWYTFLHMPFSRAVRKGVRGKVNLTPWGLASRRGVAKRYTWL